MVQDLKMRVRTESIVDSLHPSEACVMIQGADGITREVVVSRGSIEDSALVVDYARKVDGGNVMVRLPRETSCGSWGITIPHTSLLIRVPAGHNAH